MLLCVRIHPVLDSVTLISFSELSRHCAATFSITVAVLRIALWLDQQILSSLNVVSIDYREVQSHEK